MGASASSSLHLQQQQLQQQQQQLQQLQQQALQEQQGAAAVAGGMTDAAERWQYARQQTNLGRRLELLELARQATGSATDGGGSQLPRAEEGDRMAAVARAVQLQNRPYPLAGAGGGGGAGYGGGLDGSGSRLSLTSVGSMRSPPPQHLQQQPVTMAGGGNGMHAALAAAAVEEEDGAVSPTSTQWSVSDDGRY
jgi:hypothetical protein